jgi:hypothetical protein
MGERRTLTDGLKATPRIDPQVAKEFVYGEKSAPSVENSRPVSRSEVTMTAAPLNRVSFSSRIRADFATALKRASLERQLEGVEPNTLQDILEQAIEPWLKSNGYLA